jgi:hypothetical protein
VTVHGPYGQLKLSRSEPRVAVFSADRLVEYRIRCR